MEFLKPFVFFVRGLKNTVGCLQDFRFSFSSVVGYVGMFCGVEVQVGVCRLVCHKLGCALGMLRFNFCSPLRPIFAARCANFLQPSALQIGAAESARLLAKFVLHLWCKSALCAARQLSAPD